MIDETKIPKIIKGNTHQKLVEWAGVSPSTAKQWKTGEKDWRKSKFEAIESLYKNYKEEIKMSRFIRKEFVLITERKDFIHVNDEGIAVGFKFTNDAKYHAVAVVEIIDQQTEQISYSYDPSTKYWFSKHFDLKKYNNMNTLDEIHELIDKLNDEDILYEVYAQVLSDEE